MGHRNGQTLKAACYLYSAACGQARRQCQRPRGAISLLRLNMWRRMVMSYMPFSVAFYDQHSEARWCGHRLALLHPGKLVKASNHDSVVTQHDGPSFTDRVLIA